MDSKRILIIRLSAIGDVIHTLPCLNALRRQFPEAYIAWVVEDFVSDLVKDHPQLDEVFIIPKKKWRRFKPSTLTSEMLPFIKTLRSKKFDVSIDFQGLTKSSVLGYLSGAKMRLGFAGKDGRELSRFFNNTLILPPPSARHVVKRNYSLLRGLGIENSPSDAVIPMDDESVKYSEDFLKEHNPDGAPLIAIQVCAGWETKELPVDTVVELSVRLEKELGHRALFLWGPGEESSIKRVVKTVQERGGTPLIAPPTSLRQLAALIKECRLMIGGDTGPLHMAAVLDVPVVSIFGGSDAARNAPYTDRQYIIQRTDLPCVPCWKTRCPLKGNDHLRCLRSIEVGKILEGVTALLDSS